VIESIVLAILGGAFIGLAASAMLYLSGRIAGISGILGGLLQRPKTDSGWRLAFLGGLFVGGLLLSAFFPGAIQSPTGRSLILVGLAGGMVGFGTRLGNGCTSGHGVCGLTRLSKRSFVATLTFMGSGFVTATIIGLFSEGAQ
jgi:uncharacterized protein